MSLKGMTFKDTINYIGSDNSYPFKFISNGITYDYIDFRNWGSYWFMRYGIDYQPEDEVYYSDSGWYNEAYQTIEIIEEPTDEAFIAWLNNNTLTIAEMITAAAENTERAYKAGKAKGRKVEHQEWWESFQFEERNEQTSYYIFGFCGHGWDDTTFKPIKDIRPVGNTTGLFRYTRISDIVASLEQCGVVLDLSNVTTFSNMFEQCWTKRLGVIDARANTGAFSSVFASCSVERIEELILNETTTNFNYAFQSCSRLVYIRIGGVIAGSINFQWSPLDAESMKSAITHLKNFVGTDKQDTQKLTFSEDCWTALEASGGVPEGYNSWREYVMVGLGWLT